MEANKKMFVTAAILSVVPAVFEGIKIRRKGREERKDLEAKLQRELTSIHVASALVQERIRNGKYNSLDEVMTDLKFEFIVQAEEEM
jgi:hypothetical protein